VSHHSHSRQSSHAVEKLRKPLAKNLIRVDVPRGSGAASPSSGLHSDLRIDGEQVMLPKGSLDRLYPDSKPAASKISLAMLPGAKDKK
jgi:hypothetical protein